MRKPTQEDELKQQVSQSTFDIKKFVRDKNYWQASIKAKELSDLLVKAFDDSDLVQHNDKETES